LTQRVFNRRPPNFVVVASIALASLLSSAAQSSADCGGYCEARQTRAICHHAVRKQGLQASASDAEFEKCKANPLSYLDKSSRKGT
jgi:hypothetical protein